LHPLKTIQAITFDFWGTLYYSIHPNNTGRVSALQKALQAAGQPALPAEILEQAIQTSWQEWVRVWEEEHRTWGAVDWLAHLKQLLGFQLPGHIETDLIQELEEVLLDGNTQPIQGVLQMIPALAGQYRLGLISDTGISSGKTLSKLLARDGLLPYFSCLIYSDEVHKSKPDPIPFQAALQGLGKEAHQTVHVGDLRRTDITGARNAGLWSIRFSGHQDDAHIEYGDGDVVLADYEQMPAALQTIEELAQRLMR
jgi:putative hydrolase of the HAD superfamily